MMAHESPLKATKKIKGPHYLTHNQSLRELELFSPEKKKYSWNILSTGKQIIPSALFFLGFCF